MLLLIDVAGTITTTTAENTCTLISLPMFIENCGQGLGFRLLTYSYCLPQLIELLWAIIASIEGSLLFHLIAIIKVRIVIQYGFFKLNIILMPSYADRRLLGQVQDSLVHKADGSIVLVVDGCHFKILWRVQVVVLTFFDWGLIFIVI